jgi:hypothetical protein
MVFLLSLDRRGGREWSGRRKSRVAYRQCTPWCVFGGLRAGARRLAEQDASHMPRNVPRWVDAGKRGSAYNQVACGPSGVSPRRPRLTSGEGSYADPSSRSRRGTAGRRRSRKVTRTCSANPSNATRTICCRSPSPRSTDTSRVRDCPSGHSLGPGVVERAHAHGPQRIQDARALPRRHIEGDHPLRPSRRRPSHRPRLGGHQGRGGRRRWRWSPDRLRDRGSASRERGAFRELTGLRLVTARFDSRGQAFAFHPTEA